MHYCMIICYGKEKKKTNTKTGKVMEYCFKVLFLPFIFWSEANIQVLQDEGIDFEEQSKEIL